MHRCNHTFEPEAWTREHDQACQIDLKSDADILEEVNGRTVWQCPHEAIGEIDGKGKCVFHLPPEECPDDVDPVEEFVAIVDGERGAVEGEGRRPAQFIGATFEDLYLDREKIGAGEVIDLRHARIGSMVWEVEAVDAPLNASGAVIKSECVSGSVLFGGAVRFQGTQFRGEVSFADQEFEHSVSLKTATFDGGATFEGPAFFMDATFERPTAFMGATFEGRADFKDVTFNDEASFKDATFNDEASFMDATFNDEVYFKDLTFNHGAFFMDATFHGRASFMDATFNDEVYFKEATFEGMAAFMDATFEGMADFMDATFEGMASFMDATLEGRADFMDATFEGIAGFKEATFNHEAAFMGATFNHEAAFMGATFNDEADFREVTFNDEAAFREATFNDEADFSELELAGANFQGADLPNGNLENAGLEGADLRNADLTGANLENAILTRTQLYGTDFTDSRLHGTLFGDARISDATTFIERGVMWSPLRRLVPYLNKVRGVDISVAHTVIYDPRTEPVYGPGNDGENDTDDNGERDDDSGISNHTQAAMVYQALESLASDNAASTLASTCFAWRKDMQRKRLPSNEGKGNQSKPIQWLFSWLSNLVTRYGESPYRVLATAGVVIVTSGLLYYRFDLIRPDVPPYQSVPPVTLFDVFYFSTMTFTTLGYGDFQPANQLGRLVSISETSAGVVLLALLVFVFGRRATR